MKELTVTQEMILKIQKMVREFPLGTAQVCHDTVELLLEVVAAYQGHVNELKMIIQGQDADMQRMKKTIEYHQRKLFEKKGEEKKPSLILPDSLK